MDQFPGNPGNCTAVQFPVDEQATPIPLPVCPNGVIEWQVPTTFEWFKAGVVPPISIIQMQISPYPAQRVRDVDEFAGIVTVPKLQT